MQEAVRQAAHAEAGEAFEAAAQSSGRSAFRKSRIVHKKSVHAQLEAFDARVADLHAASQARRHGMERTDLRVEHTLAETNAARRVVARSAAAAEAAAGINAFEINLRRVAQGGEDGDADALPPIGKTPYDHMARIKQFLPQQARLQKEGEAYMERLHATHASNVQAGKERHARRRRLVRTPSRMRERCGRGFLMTCGLSMFFHDLAVAAHQVSSAVAKQLQTTGIPRNRTRSFDRLLRTETCNWG